MTLDLREEFRAEVVTPFVASYRAGETPNPCTRCNGAFRFDALLAFASRAGAERLWTGHYARIVERDGRRLARACGATRRRTSRTCSRPSIRPCSSASSSRSGDQSKDETRAEAARAGLPAASRPESQEACFLAGDDYRRFLERQGLEPAREHVVDESGDVVGRHDGYWRFTPGQRRGLGIAAARPLYVLRTDPRLEPGRRRRADEALAASRVDAERVLYAPVSRAAAKLRYRSEPVFAAVSPTRWRILARARAAVVRGRARPGRRSLRR